MLGCGNSLEKDFGGSTGSLEFCVDRRDHTVLLLTDVPEMGREAARRSELAAEYVRGLGEIFVGNTG